MKASEGRTPVELADSITLDFANVLGVIGVCRVAAASDAEVLREADLPAALDSARSMVTSLRDRVLQLHDAAARSQGC